MNNKEEQRPFPLSFLFGCPKAFQSRFSRLLFTYLLLFLYMPFLLVFSSIYLRPLPPPKAFTLVLTSPYCLPSPLFLDINEDKRDD